MIFVSYSVSLYWLGLAWGYTAVPFFSLFLCFFMCRLRGLTHNTGPSSFALAIDFSSLFFALSFFFFFCCDFAGFFQITEIAFLRVALHKWVCCARLTQTKNRHYEATDIMEWGFNVKWTFTSAGFPQLLTCDKTLPFDPFGSTQSAYLHEIAIVCCLVEVENFFTSRVYRKVIGFFAFSATESRKGKKGSTTTSREPPLAFVTAHHGQFDLLHFGLDRIKSFVASKIEENSLFHSTMNVKFLFQIRLLGGRKRRRPPRHMREHFPSPLRESFFPLAW